MVIAAARRCGWAEPCGAAMMFAAIKIESCAPMCVDVRTADKALRSPVSCSEMSEHAYFCRLWCVYVHACGLVCIVWSPPPLTRRAVGSTTVTLFTQSHISTIRIRGGMIVVCFQYWYCGIRFRLPYHYNILQNISFTTSSTMIKHDGIVNNNKNSQILFIMW